MSSGKINAADTSASQANPPAAPGERSQRLRELALLFLRLGTTAFGGPAAHLAMMQQEVVVRRQWLTAAEFLDMWAAANFIPGPSSTEMAIHIGYRRAGWRGLLVAGSCFIFPAALMCMVIAAFYRAYGRSPVSESILWGVKPVVIAVVGQALYRLGRSAIKSWLLAAIAAAAIVLLILHWNQLLVLFGGGVIAALFRAWPQRRAMPLLAWPGLLAQTTTAAATAAANGIVTAPLAPLFLVFLKIGSVLFGSGYVLLAFLKADLVDRYHWVSNKQLLDAIAVGQVTPGPVFTTATFIGYVVAGPAGGIVATLGIFIPAFFFVAVSAPLLPRMRKSKVFTSFLDGLNASSLALMAYVLLLLAGDVLRTGIPPTAPLWQFNGWAAAMTAVSLVALLLWKNLNSAWLVLAGAAIGLAHGLLA
jgi:chromate transporter